MSTITWSANLMKVKVIFYVLCEIMRTQGTVRTGNNIFVNDNKSKDTTELSDNTNYHKQIGLKSYCSKWYRTALLGTVLVVDINIVTHILS